MTKVEQYILIQICMRNIGRIHPYFAEGTKIWETMALEEKQEVSKIYMDLQAKGALGNGTAT